MLRPHDLAIELVLSNAADDLLQREADIAIRMFQPTQSALVTRRIGAFTLGLHAHPDYLARRGSPGTLEDLQGHDIIGYDVDTPAIRAFLQPWPMLHRAAFSLRVDSDVGQLAAIRAGYGIGVCQTAVAAMAPRLTRVLPDLFNAKLETWIVMHEDMRSSTRCRVVFDALVERLPALSG